MTTAQVGIVVVYAFIVAVWPIRLLVLHIILRRQCALTHQSPRYDQQSPPLVSAILPAKDEEAYLALCLESIRKLTYPNLEILVVDDRSTDRTGDIAREIASTDERIRVITIDELPPGWTGKTHALKRASHMAHGQWLLFVDADTIHAPDSLGIVMEYARSQQAVLASLLPELRCESFWERVMQPIAAITLMQSFPLHKINDNRSKLAFANGQYILIARQAYDAAGGHKAVRDRFVEDIALAQRVKALGFPIRAALARGVVTCRMYASLAQLIKGWSRIFYDALGRSSWRLTKKLLDPIIFCQTGQLALAAGFIVLARDGGPFAISLIFLSVAHHVFMYFVFQRVYRTSIDSATFSLWYPIANFIVDLILIRAIGMCLTGNVTWRGTSYAATASVPHFGSDSRK